MQYFDSADWQMEGGGPGGAKAKGPGGPMRPGMKNKPPLPAGAKAEAAKSAQADDSSSEE
jgi:hypothetical protein